MNDEQLSYSPDEMTTTAGSLKTFLTNQFQEHTRLFMNQPDSYYNLIAGVGHVFGKVVSQGNELADTLTKYHQQYQQIYQALYTLADQIDKAAQAARGTDQNVDQLFVYNQE